MQMLKAPTNTVPAGRCTLRLPRTSHKAAKASWMNPPTRRTRLDHAIFGLSSPAGDPKSVTSRSFVLGTS